MPDPFSIGALVVGGGLDIASGIQQAQAIRRAALLRQAIDEGNAELLDAAAADAVQRGSYSEGIAKLQGGAKIGSQKAAYANSGVDVQSGSALDTYGATAMSTEMDAQIIRADARRAAWGYSVKAGQARLAAKLD